MTPPASRLRTWLQLFRAPNLFTVPGDPIAGYVLASFGALEPALLLAVIASLCLYAAGLLDNDLADLAEDRAERPHRPLPSGAAQPVAVAIVALLLLAIGLVCAAAASITALKVAAVLAIAIAFYNHWGKRIPIFGALNMGACRGLSLLLGATAAPHGELTISLLARGRLDPLFVAILLVTLYIAAITHLARYETKSQVPIDAKWLPISALLFGMISFLRQLPAPSFNGGLVGFLEQLTPTTFWSVFFLYAVAFVTCLQITWKLATDPEASIPPSIGQFIRLLLLLQAAFCVANASLTGTAAAMLLLILWPLSRAASKRFYAS
ncbi:MAG TPA: UbiA family prenyltransferase [Chthoniobacteraceae bacterium]|jgi:4-hydroxybenzoate polyprenyltransferase